jgi:hypothetical protein
MNAARSLLLRMGAPDTASYGRVCGAQRANRFPVQDGPVANPLSRVVEQTPQRSE